MRGSEGDSDTLSLATASPDLPLNANHLLGLDTRGRKGRRGRRRVMGEGRLEGGKGGVRRL